MTTNHEELRAAASHPHVTGATRNFVSVCPLALAELLAEFDMLKAGTTVKRGKKEYPVEFSAAYDAMKDAGAKWREGSTPAAAFKQWQARIKAGADAGQILGGVRRYGAYIKATAGEPKMAQTFFGPGEHYTAAWAINRGVVTKHVGAAGRAQQQADATAEAMARINNLPFFDPNVIDMEGA